jgi:hypothetical protein
MAENFSDLRKETEIQVQEVQITTKETIPERPTLRCVIKLSK